MISVNYSMCTDWRTQLLESDIGLQIVEMSPDKGSMQMKVFNENLGV